VISPPADVTVPGKGDATMESVISPPADVTVPGKGDATMESVISPPADVTVPCVEEKREPGNNGDTIKPTTPQTTVDVSSPDSLSVPAGESQAGASAEAESYRSLMEAGKANAAWRVLQANPVQANDPQEALMQTQLKFQKDVLADVEQNLPDLLAVRALVGKASGDWKNTGASAPVECFVKCDKGKVFVCAVGTSKPQADGQPLLARDPRLGDGIIPTFMDIENWPNWFPLCKKVRLIHSFSSLPRRHELWVLTFGVGFVSLEAPVHLFLQDFGSTLKMYMAAATNENSLGITVPPRSMGCIRVVVDWLCLSFEPLSEEDCQWGLGVATDDLVKLQWVWHILWSTLSGMTVPAAASTTKSKSKSKSPSEKMAELSMDVQRLFKGCLEHSKTAT